MTDGVINKTIYKTVEKQYFQGLEPQKGLQLNFPHVTLVRPRANCLKGMMSEVEEIFSSMYQYRSDLYPRPLEKHIDNITEDGIANNEDEFLEEVVDLVFYTLGFLGLYYSDDKINEIFLRGVEKNYARGYFTQTEYQRDQTRGY